MTRPERVEIARDGRAVVTYICGHRVEIDTQADGEPADLAACPVCEEKS